MENVAVIKVTHRSNRLEEEFFLQTLILAASKGETNLKDDPQSVQTELDNQGWCVDVVAPKTLHFVCLSGTNRHVVASVLGVKMGLTPRKPSGCRSEKETAANHKHGVVIWTQSIDKRWETENE